MGCAADPLFSDLWLPRTAFQKTESVPPPRLPLTPTRRGSDRSEIQRRGPNPYGCHPPGDRSGVRGEPPARTGVPRAASEPVLPGDGVLAGDDHVAVVERGVALGELLAQVRSAALGARERTGRDEAPLRVGTPAHGLEPLLGAHDARV